MEYEECAVNARPAPTPRHGRLNRNLMGTIRGERMSDQHLRQKLREAHRQCRDFKHLGELLHEVMLEEMYEEVNA